MSRTIAQTLAALAGAVILPCLPAAAQSDGLIFEGSLECSTGAYTVIKDVRVCFDPTCGPLIQDCCEHGKPRQLTMEYTGEDCDATTHAQDPGKVYCEDFGALPDPAFILATDKEDPFDGGAKIWFNGDVPVGSTYDISALAGGEPELKSATFVHIFDVQDGTLLQTVEFHTSCSQPLSTGNQFGASRIVDCAGKDQPIEGDCCAAGKPRRLVFEYTGAACTASSHSQDPGKVSCEDSCTPLPNPAFIFASQRDEDHVSHDHQEVWFTGFVSVGDSFAMDSLAGGKDHLSSETFILVYDGDPAAGGNLCQRIKFHTSCSQPLFVGNQFGSALLQDCVGEDEPIEGDCCTNGKPRVLTMTYNGLDCTATSHMQSPDKVNCEDYEALTDPVYVLATDKENPDDGGAKVWFNGDVALGGIYDINAMSAGEDDLKSATFVHIYDVQGGTLLQSVEFHTSCSQPLAVGDRFGASEVVNCVGKDEPVPGDCCANGNLQALVMQFLPTDCGDPFSSTHSQSPDKVSCEDFGPLTDPVYILATDKENPADGGAKVWFAGDVAAGGLFTLDAAAAGEDKFKSATWIHIFDAQGGTELQRIEFHTSCSQPLFAGNQFGSALVINCVGEDGPAIIEDPCDPFPEDGYFTYIYKISNAETSSIGALGLEVTLLIDPNNVIDAGFFDGDGVEPALTLVEADRVTWFFFPQTILPGQMSEELYIVSPLGPEEVGFAVLGEFGLDCTGVCVGPGVVCEFCPGGDPCFSCPTGPAAGPPCN